MAASLSGWLRERPPKLFFFLFCASYGWVWAPPRVCFCFFPYAGMPRRGLPPMLLIVLFTSLPSYQPPRRRQPRWRLVRSSAFAPSQPCQPPHRGPTPAAVAPPPCAPPHAAGAPPVGRPHSTQPLCCHQSTVHTTTIKKEGVRRGLRGRRGAASKILHCPSRPLSNVTSCDCLAVQIVHCRSRGA